MIVLGLASKAVISIIPSIKDGDRKYLFLTRAVPLGAVVGSEADKIKVIVSYLTSKYDAEIPLRMINNLKTIGRNKIVVK